MSPVCATRVPGAGMARCAALAVPFPPFAAATGREALQGLLWEAVSQMAFKKEDPKAASVQFEKLVAFLDCFL